MCDVYAIIEARIVLAGKKRISESEKISSYVRENSISWGVATIREVPSTGEAKAYRAPALCMYP